MTFNRLPPGWGLATVRDIGSQTDSAVLTGPFGSNLGTEDFVAEGTPVLTIGCLTENGISLNKAVYVSEQKANDLERYKLDDGDVLFSRMASVGRASLVPKSLSRALYNYHIIRLRINPTLCLPEFLLWYIKGAPTARRYITDVSRGATRDGMNTAQLLAMPVTLPPLNEQERINSAIGARFENVRRARALLGALPNLLDRLRQSILAAAFRGDLTAEWRARNPDVEPADKLLEKIRAERRRRWEETELARLMAKGKPPTDEHWKARYRASDGRVYESQGFPASWVLVDAGLLMSWSSGRFLPQSEMVSGPYPVFGGNGISGYHNCSNASRSTLVVGRVGAQCGNVHVVEGRAWITDNALYADYFPSAIDLRFMAWFLRGAHLRERAGGSGQPFVSQRTLDSTVVRLPPLAEQRVIVLKIQQAWAVADEVETRQQQVVSALESLSASVLAKAFRGELVPQDPNDTPASVLLERLSAEAGVSPAKAGRTRKPTRSQGPTTPKPENSTTLPTRAPIANAEPAGSFVETAPGSAPVTASPPVQQTLRLATPVSDFLDLSAEAQTTNIHHILLGEGPLEREDAVRRAAELFRDAGQASFQRLRRDGPLATCIDAALAVGLRQGHFDRPSPGTVRAIAREPGDVSPALWRRALLAALADPAVDDDAAVRAAAAWSQAQFGLEFQRLRTGGHIDTALRAALTDLLRTGEVTRDRRGTLRARIG